MTKLGNINTGVDTNATSKHNGTNQLQLIAEHQNRIDTLRSITERTPLILQANSKRDIFTSSVGKNNTVDTGNTTATFNTDHYIGDLSGEASGTKTAASYTSNNNMTTNFTAVSAGYISAFTFGYGAGSNNIDYYVYVKNSLGTTIASKSYLQIDGDGSRSVTFSASDYSEFIGAGETFSIQVTSSSADTLYKSSNTQTYSGTHFGYSSQRPPVTTRNGTTVTSFTYQAIVDGVVETEQLISSGENIDSIFISAQTEDDGTNVMTYDVSVDDGNTWTTGLSLNTINSITSTAGNQLIIRFNLHGDSATRFFGYSYVIGRVS